MQHSSGKLLLLLSLFLLSGDSTWACGNKNAGNAVKAQQEASDKSCCSENDAETSCTDDSERQHSSAECPCDHDRGGCHCSGCSMVCHAGATCALTTPPVLLAHLFNNSVQKLAFYFSEHLPKAVHLPIWQPPKWMV